MSRAAALVTMKKNLQSPPPPSLALMNWPVVGVHLLVAASLVVVFKGSPCAWCTKWSKFLLRFKTSVYSSVHVSRGWNVKSILNVDMGSLV